MKYLTVNEVIAIHDLVIVQSGGAAEIRDRNGLESAVAQPQLMFGGDDLYPSLSEKATALGFTLIKNHPYVDGNKRIGHAAMETFLIINGFELKAEVDDQETVIQCVAAGSMDRTSFLEWVSSHLTKTLFR